MGDFISDLELDKGLVSSLGVKTGVDLTREEVSEERLSLEYFSFLILVLTFYFVYLI